jgi:hypothetical protein
VKMAQISAKQAVTPQMEAAGQVNPVQALVNEQTQKLALIKAYEQARVLTHDQATALMQAADTAYKTNLINAQWEIWSNQSTLNQALAASLDALGNNASSALSGIITGTQSASDAVSSLASSVVNQLVNSFVQMGIQWVKSAIMGQAAQTSAIATVSAVQNAAVGTQLAVSTGAAAATTAAWTPAAIMASIASMGTAAKIGLAAVAALGVAAIAGKRKNGGPVSAGSMYQVGENGLPEIFQASNGNQYMIPGDSGRVISNKDISGGGSGVVVYNNVINNSSGATATSTATDNGDGTVTIETIVADIENGGPISQAITSNTTATRRATE